MANRILVIVGPTASGKTKLALSIARSIPSEIISADSRQVYKHLDIGTAKPVRSQLLEIPHHGIDIREPDQKFNAGDFQSLGRELISNIHERNKLPIICGGTGLYLQALIDGFFRQPEISGIVRETLEDRILKDGKESLFRELQKIDPESARTMDATKYRRVIRALEIYYETGIPISQFHAKHKKDNIYESIWIGLKWERTTLYHRINSRVDLMLQRGFLEEVQKCHSLGYDDRLQALQTVGYKEAFQYLRKEIIYERMVILMKQNTRRYAKRQMTWFKKENRIRWISIFNEDQIDEVAKDVIAQLNE